MVALSAKAMRAFDSLPLIGGHAALDLLNTVEYRGRQDCGDRLNSFANLVRWSATAGLLTQAELIRMATRSDKRSPACARSLAAAKELREALYAVLVAHLNEGPLPRTASRIVEHQIREARSFSRLQYVDGASPFSWHVPIHSPENVTARIADSASHLLLSLDRVVVNQCSGPNCDWFFIDHSHGHRRLWCQPNKCGNVVRVRRSRRGDRWKRKF